MRILLVSHAFPPRASAGTELYTAEIATRLSARGHEVSVFSAAKDISRRHLSLHARTWHGVRVHELVNNLFHRSFRETWELPAAEERFAAILAREGPELVHFQHLLYLSSGFLSRAHAVAPVAFTLHDYWLQCPRFGQRVHADGGVCHTIDYARCGTCLSTFKHAQTSTERRVGRVLARVRRLSGVDLAPLARRTAAKLARPAAPSVVAARAHDLAEEARLRADELRSRVRAHVDLFLAPSRFLRSRLVDEFGLPAERVEHLPLGVDLAPAPARHRRGDRPLRVLFVGTLTPNKGPHLLLEAWAKLSPRVKERAQLALFGPGQHDPVYQRRLRELARSAGATLGGRLSRDEVGQELARADLLVVPSVWFENSPLVILEALSARTPLLVGDQGGMAELVEDGVSGFHFRLGDGADLARRLEELLRSPERLDALHPRPPRLMSVDDHVDALEERYRRLVDERRARR